MDWTKEQKQAIYEKDSNILVAAAAGSGKTAVLVERIINKIINEDIDIDKLLVVTFTKAAASEMRERVLEAIYKKLEDEPDNEKLQRQITLLNKSSICTIDSFCLDIIKNNFYEIDISPNFRIADTAEIQLLKQETLEELFEEKYENKDSNFIKLLNTYTSYRDDEPLKELILKIYTYIQSSPFPEKWLNEKIEMFNIGENLNQDFALTSWGEILLEDVEEELIDCIITLQNAAYNLSLNPDLIDFERVINDDINQLQTLKQNLNSWDAVYAISQNLEYISWPRKKIESDIKDNAKKVRDSVKAKLKKKLDKILIYNSLEANQDIFDMYDILCKLQDIILEFGKLFAKKKKDKNIVDFNDIEHFALKILYREDEDGNIEQTDVAKKYKSRFNEIAIDEYQDSNLVQEYILTAVSNGNNIFMVGDVKQSIYRFRQARPKLFLDKYATYKLKDNKTQKDNLKIQLFKNFRSRQGVLDFTNLVFEDIMSNRLGSIEYTQEEFLNLGANYENTKQNLKTEINIIDMYNNNKDEDIVINSEDEQNASKEDDENEIIENAEVEAKFVAKRIQELIQSHYQVYNAKEGKFRNITYKDIVILLRSTKDIAPIYEKEILKLNMPVFCDASAEYLESIEIQTVMSALKIIDNPLQDIPLVATLRSPMFSFTDNELVQIRLADKYDNFYETILKARANVDLSLRNKIDNFLNQIALWRKEQEYLALDELIWKIYSDTGYYNYVGLMPNGELRQANLKMLFERAKQYETASFKGLFNFINFIEKLQVSSGDLDSAKLIGENENVIRIMSIHKSKGLEFPIVFLSNTGKGFNFMDLREKILLDQDMGIGVKYIDYDMQIEYDTLSKEAVKSGMLVETLSEEMRILYVALTRAKEKLIITGISKDSNSEIHNMQNLVDMYSKDGNKINPVLVKKYKKYLDWIMLVYLYEKDRMQDIADLSIINYKDILKDDKEEEKEIDVLKILKEEKASEDDCNKVKNIIEYKYENILATTLPTKTSVTAIKQMKMEKQKESVKENLQEETISFKEPQFVRKNEDIKITSAQKGTLTHLCLQKLDEKKNYNLDMINELINNLCEKEIITKQEADAISAQKILAFTKSNIWKELKEAKEVYKEKPFYINISANEIYDETVDETVLVQGIVDLYFINKNDEIVLVDYKTDYVEQSKEQELVNKYREQLNLYKRALEEALNKKVTNVYIYSTWLNKEIAV